MPLVWPRGPPTRTKAFASSGVSRAISGRAKRDAEQSGHTLERIARHVNAARATAVDPSTIPAAVAWPCDLPGIVGWPLVALASLPPDHPAQQESRFVEIAGKRFLAVPVVDRHAPTTPDYYSLADCRVATVDACMRREEWLEDHKSDRYEEIVTLPAMDQNKPTITRREREQGR